MDLDRIFNELPANVGFYDQSWFESAFFRMPRLG